METIHQKLERIRKPRVHIKYEVETENTVVLKELPFVIGVLGDFSADSTETQRPLRDRKFIQIDRDNFNQVMKRLHPELNFSVENKLDNNNQNINIHLKFESLEDFEPAAIVKQVPALKKLLDTRNKLRDLLARSERSEDLENILEKILQNPQDLKYFSDLPSNNNRSLN